MCEPEAGEARPDGEGTDGGDRASSGDMGEGDGFCLGVCIGDWE